VVQMTSGGTESIMLACKAYRDLACSRGIQHPEMLVLELVFAAKKKPAVDVVSCSDFSMTDSVKFHRLSFALFSFNFWCRDFFLLRVWFFAGIRWQFLYFVRHFGHMLMHSLMCYYCVHLTAFFPEQLG